MVAIFAIMDDTANIRLVERLTLARMLYKTKYIPVITNVFVFYIWDATMIIFYKKKFYLFCNSDVFDKVGHGIFPGVHFQEFDVGEEFTHHPDLLII